MKRKFMTGRQRMEDRSNHESLMAGRTKNAISAAFEKALKEKEATLFSGSVKISDVFGVSGVYGLFNKGKLVYVGESACILTRISEHVREGIKEFDHYKILQRVAGVEARLKAERTSIKKYRPIYNYTHNPNVCKL